MLGTIVEFAVRFRGFVLLAIGAIIVFGSIMTTHLPIDAFPDISPVMVPVFAEAHGMAPEEVERLITAPIESTMNGLPGVTQVKSTSAFGMAVIYIFFKDGTDIYFARQIVAERLSGAMAELPDLHEKPALGPISTGLGQIYIYYLKLEPGTDTGGKDPNTYLREINDWQVKFQLQTVPGVTDILSVGGHVLQYQIKVNPYALQKFKLTLDDVILAVRDNNRNAGGQYIVVGSEEYLVRGIGLVQTLDHLKNIQVKVVESVPIILQDIAEIAYGNEIRRGVVTRNGEEEVVSGMVLQLFGENTSKVIERLSSKIIDVQASLPKGVTLVPYYEQAELVREATSTVKRSLIQGAVLILIVLVLFLGNVRTAFIVALTLPVCVFVAILFMSYAGLSANLMSLGGIAVGIGMLGDGSIVMVENIYRFLSKAGKSDRRKEHVVIAAAREVSRPIIFSVSIIIIVFLPLFTLQGVEGKMFSPMAFTISFALLGSLFAALLMTPALSMFLLKQGERKEFILLTALRSMYSAILQITLRWKKSVVFLAVLIFAASLALIPYLGTEFVPTLEEGSILIGVTLAPSIALEKAVETVMKLEREIMRFDEVRQTVSRTGRPEAGSHPHPVNYAEIHVELKPRKEWQNYQTKNQLIAALTKAIGSYPGIQLNFTQPIQNAFDELLSGIRAQLAIKIFGEDLTVLRTTATQIRNAIDAVPGLVDLSVEQSFGQPQIQIIPDREACARYGITVSTVLDLVEKAIGGEVIDTIYLESRRFGIHVRYLEEFRNDPHVLENMMVMTPNNQHIPLEQIADIRSVIGPTQINRENNRRRWTIQANVRDRDMGSVVADIRQILDTTITLPPGYHIEFGGQFENQERAMKRLAMIVPLTIIIIFLMLYGTFGSIRYALLIIMTIPMALIGGVFGLYLSGEYLSVPATIGFIALFGIAVQNGVVLIAQINQLHKDGAACDMAVLEGCCLRLRPVLMTALTTVLGLIPLLLSSGIGAEVQRPLAIVVVYGLCSSTFLTLFLIPALYEWFKPKGDENPQGATCSDL